jgi:GxxExxY protein
MVVRLKYTSIQLKLLESVYHSYKKRINNWKLIFKTELIIPVHYKGLKLKQDYDDLLIENCLVVELKALEKIYPYMKLK